MRCVFSRDRVVVALLVLTFVGFWVRRGFFGGSNTLPSEPIEEPARPTPTVDQIEVDVPDLWKTLPQPNDVGLNGSIQQIAVALGKLVELPAGYGWAWEHVEEDWDADHPLIELRHNLPLRPYGVPGDGGLPLQLVELIDEMSWRLAFKDFDRYAVQGHRIVLLYIGPDPRPEAICLTVASLADVRLVTGGGRDEERWEIRQATPLSACPSD